MDSFFDMSKWFNTVVRAAWVFFLVPVSLVICFSALLYRRRSVAPAAIRAIALATQAAGIPPYRRALSHLAQELARARRYHHPLTVVVLGLENALSLELQRDPHRNGATPRQQVHFGQFAFPFVGAIVRDALRESDIVTYDAANNHYVILFVESTQSQTRQALQRLVALLMQRSLPPLQIGLAEFPIAGLTIEDLVTRAREACNHWPLYTTAP